MKLSESTAFWVVVFILMIGMYACRSQRPVAENSSGTCFPEISGMPDSVYCAPNTDSSFYLCQDKKVLKAHALYPRRLNRILIIRCDNGSVILQEEIPGGSARWAGVDEVEIFSPSGIPRNSSETTYRYNVISQKKIYLNSNKE